MYMRLTGASYLSYVIFLYVRGHTEVIDLGPWVVVVRCAPGSVVE